MSINHFVHCLLVFFIHCQCLLAQEDTFTKEVYSYKGISLPYRKTAVGRNDPGTSLVVYLHGGSAKGNDNEAQLREPGIDSICSWLKVHGRNALLIVPQCPQGKSWAGPLTGAVKSLLQTFIDKGVADGNRVYILGGSMGGTGTWHMTDRYPAFFAAAMPVAGNPEGLAAEAVSQTPVCTVMGTADAMMDIPTVEDFIGEMENYGATCRLDIEQGWTHEDVCQRSYSAERLEWVFSHSRHTSSGMDRPAPADDSQPLSVCWYDPSGRRVEGAPRQHGVFLKQTKYADGSVVCEMTVVR